MSEIFLDRSAWIAVADSGDRHHQQAVEYFTRLLHRSDTLVTSSDTLADTYARLTRSAGPHVADRFRDMVRAAQDRGLVEVVPVDSELRRKAWDIYEQHHNRVSSFENCISFVAAGRRGVRDIFSFSPDFASLGFRVWPPTDGGDDGNLRNQNMRATVGSDA